MVKDAETFGIDPAGGHSERALALSYAPPGARHGIAALLALDETLARIVASAQDPIVAQMRLTWWHQALCDLDDRPPPAQPVLRALRDAVLPAGETGAGLAGLVDGWEGALDGEAFVAADHARDRGERLFAGIAQVCGATLLPGMVEAAGWWAIDDLAHRGLIGLTPIAATAPERVRWPARLRVLGALTLIARTDRSAQVPPGHPRRVARLIALRLTGY